MTIKRSIFALAILSAVFLIGPAKPASAQDLTTCSADDLDTGDCGGCLGGWNADGTCGGEGGGGGGASCPTTNPGVYLVFYSDGAVDSSGNLEVWMVSSNSDGNSGEGTLTASIRLIPDGTNLPPQSMSTPSNSSVSAALSSDISSISDLGLGQLTFLSGMDWNCGVSSTSILNLGFGGGPVLSCTRVGGAAPVAGGHCGYVCTAADGGGSLRHPFI